MIKKVIFITSCLISLLVMNSCKEQTNIREYKGVVTLHIIPAKVIRVNEIIENPKPGTSYIGDEGILVEIDENIEMMANWTIVKIEYYQYPKPKIIKYKILSDEAEITVKYRAVKLEVVGDLSSYIKQ